MRKKKEKNEDVILECLACRLKASYLQVSACNYTAKCPLQVLLRILIFSGSSYTHKYMLYFITTEICSAGLNIENIWLDVNKL